MAGSTYTRLRLKQLVQELRSKTGSPLTVTQLIVLAPSNDPYYSLSKFNQPMAEWFKQIFDKVTGETGAERVHVRRLHYWFVSQPDPKRADGTPFLNDDACWHYLVNASKYARYLGMVPYSRIVDHRNPNPHQLAEYGDPYELPYEITPHGWKMQLDEPPKALFEWKRGSTFVSSPTVSFEFAGANDATELSLKLAEQAVPEMAFNCDQQHYQKFHLEVWCEKSTMDDVLLPVCRKYHANLVTSLGEQSITRVRDLMERIKYVAKKPIRIFYIADFDSKGHDMPVSVARKVQFYADDMNIKEDIKLYHLMLTEQQAIDYELPMKPRKNAQPRFQRNFKGAVELDALEALHLGEMAKILEDALSRYYDASMETKLEAAQQSLAETIENDFCAELSFHEEEIQKKIDEYNRHYEDVNRALEELQSSLDVANERAQPIIEEIEELVEEACQNTDQDLFEFDEPEVELGDELPDPLYDSERSYIDQLVRFKQFQRKDWDLQRLSRVLNVLQAEKPIKKLKEKGVE